MGRRGHRPDPSQRRHVEAMAGYGIREDDIGRALGIDPKRLRKHYREEQDSGTIKATAKVAESLHRKAIGDGPQPVGAAIFWLKTRAHWSETMVHQHAVISPEPLSASEWQANFTGGDMIDVTPTALPGSDRSER